MIVDAAWVKRNLGFDPLSTPAPESTFEFKKAAHPTKSTSEDLQREIIDFDSESPAGLQFLAFTTATGLSRLRKFRGQKGLPRRPVRLPAAPPGVRYRKRMCWWSPGPRTKAMRSAGC